MPYNSNAYNPVTNGTRYIPPPALPDAQWAAAMPGQYGTPSGGFLNWLKSKFADETGSIGNPFASSPLQVQQNVGPVQSFGSLGEMQQAAQQAASQAATQSQASKLLQARLGQYNAARPPISPYPEMQFGLPGGVQPTTMEQLAQMQQQMAGRLGSLPTTGATPAQVQEWIASQRPGQQLALNPGQQPLHGPGIPVNSEGIVNPTSQSYVPTNQFVQGGGVSNATPSAAEQIAGAAAPEAGAAAEPLGVMGKLGAFKGDIKDLYGKLSAAGGEAAAASPGMIGTMAEHPVLTGIGGALVSNFASPVGQQVNSALGTRTPGDVTEEAMRWGGNAAMIPGVGAVAAPLAAIVGGGYGAVKGPLTDLYAAQHYDDYASQFANLAHGYAQAGQDDARKVFGQAALAIHNGQDYTGTLDGQQFTIQGSKFGQGTSDVMDKALALQRLNSAMQSYKNNGYSLTPQAQQSTASPSETGLALQMGQAMQALSQNYVNQGVGAANTIRGMEAGLPAQYKPLLEADAASREAYAHQMGDAFSGAAYMQPMVQHMDQQVAYQQQMLARMRSLQTSASAGRGSLGSQLYGGAQSLAANGQAQANGNTMAMNQLNAMTAPSLGG